jgi:hypothetical protein
MYKVLDSPKRMTRKQIKEEFKGKWIFLVDLGEPQFGWFETAVPAVVADKLFEGRETGLYQKLNEEYNGNTMDWSFLPNEINVFGFSEVQPDGG